MVERDVLVAIGLRGEAELAVRALQHVGHPTMVP